MPYMNCITMYERYMNVSPTLNHAKFYAEL